MQEILSQTHLNVRDSIYKYKRQSHDMNKQIRFGIKYDGIELLHSIVSELTSLSLSITNRSVNTFLGSEPKRHSILTLLHIIL